MQQMSLSFEPGLSARSRSLREHLATQVYQRGLTAVAGKIDLSPSKLTEKLAGADSGGKPRGLTVDELEAYIAATGDTSPVLYLIDKFLRDPTVQQQEALARFATALPALVALAEAAGLSMPTSPRRARAR